MPLTKAPAGGMVANNLMVRGGRFVSKPLSRVAAVMRRLRSTHTSTIRLAKKPFYRPPSPLNTLKPHESLYQYEREKFRDLSPEKAGEHERIVDAALADKPGVLPTRSELQALSHYGKPVAGGYKDAGRLMTMALQSSTDAERWAAINAVLSANTGWLDHTRGATAALALWHAHGRPHDWGALEHLFGATHKPEKGQLTWIRGRPIGRFQTKPPGLTPEGNERRSMAPQNFYADKSHKLKQLLSIPDSDWALDPTLIGQAFKTPNFGLAHFDAQGVPIDTHMGKLLAGGGDVTAKARKRLLSANNPHIQLAYKKLVAETAKEMGWEPRAVQEAVWTAVLGLMTAKRVGATGDYKSLVNHMTQRAIRSGWDLHTVFELPAMRDAMAMLGAHGKKLEDAIDLSRTLHPLPEDKAKPEVPAHLQPALTTAASRLRPATVRTAAAHPIFNALPASVRGDTAKLAKQSTPRRTSFNALVHLILLAADQE